MSKLAEVPDQAIEEHVAERVAVAEQSLRNAIRARGEKGAPLGEVFDQVHTATNTPRALLREALALLLYSGDIRLTEDRRLIT